MEEKELISKFNYQKAEAQRLLFDKYYHKMYCVAMRYLSVREDAEDVLVEAFIRILNNIMRFRYEGEGSLTRWIKTIVINESLRGLSNRKKLGYNNDVNELIVETVEDIEGNIDMKYLLSLVESLPNGYRVVFNLFVIESYSHKEISEMLDISVSTSKSQLFKARQHLMLQLKKQKLYEMGRS